MESGVGVKKWFFFCERYNYMTSNIKTYLDKREYF